MLAIVPSEVTDSPLDVALATLVPYDLVQRTLHAADLTTARACVTEAVHTVALRARVAPVCKGQSQRHAHVLLAWLAWTLHHGATQSGYVCSLYYASARHLTK